ncbi:MAG: ArsA family ATPase, partial [Kutzneria sp.]|nr:ArsA family ATPase [Kutzneria sp.]
HPPLANLSLARARAAAHDLSEDGVAPLAAAVLRLHVDRAELAAREKRLLATFTSAHPAVAIVRVPALAEDVHDLAGLREVGRLLARHTT